MQLWGIVPLLGTVLLVGIVFGWRPWLQFRRHGTWGLALFRSRRQVARDAGAILLFVLLLGQAVVAAGSAGPLSSSIRLDPLVRDVASVVGAMLMFGGLVLLVTAQLQLGAAWRIGTIEGERPGLVTSGLYGFCRNPIYLAIFVFLTGDTCILPTWLSSGLLLGAYVGFRLQTADEEDFLLRTYGEAYRRYARRVGRFVPRAGRLS
jgi:protein-S-isoprenylcysteine O-methyltransferase Ste14